MQTESPFRIAFLIVILLATSIAIFFHRKASRSSEKITYEREGLLCAIILRLSAALLLICTIAYLLEPSSISWASLPFWLIVRWFSVFVAFIGAFLMAWTLAVLGNNLTDTVVTSADSVLIKHGPYRFVRHPYYSSTALIMAAVFVMTANLLVGTTSLVVLLLLVARTPKEEQVLIERFGQQYLDYQKSTGMFIPSLWGMGILTFLIGCDAKSFRRRTSVFMQLLCGKSSFRLINHLDGLFLNLFGNLT